MGDTASSHQADSESQPPKRPVTTVASRIVSVLGVECGLDPKTVSLSEVSDWMEKSAYVIRICGEMYKPPHKWSNLRGSAKLWSASAVRDLSVLGDPWVKIRAQYNVPVAMGVAQAVNHIVAESARRRAMYQENCRHLHKVVDKIEIESRHYLAIPAIMAAACRCGDLPPFFQVLVACWPGERILMGLMVSASLYHMLVCQPEVESSLSEKQTAAVIRIKQGMHGGPAHAAKVLARFTRPVALVAHGTPWVLQALTAAVEHRAFLDANDGTTDAAGGLRFEALHLVGTALDDAALHTLADRVLGKICAGSLARISLRDNGFGASGAAHLAAALRRHARSLQDIDLSSNLLGCVGERPQMGFLELTEGVPTCMEAGIIPLAKTLSECVELRCLQLSAAKLGSRGALALRNLASVTLSTRLTTLNLSGNSIQEPAAGLLLLSLSQPPGAGVLRKLNFSENAVESLQSFSALAQLLAPPSCARPRFGAGNVFGGTFGGCRGLTSLQLRGCGMDDKGIELWCALLEQEGGGGEDDVLEVSLEEAEERRAPHSH